MWKNSQYEGSTRIPLFIAGPGMRSNVVVQNMTQIIDTLPTLIEMGTGEQDSIPSWLDGYSLVPFLYDSSNDTRTRPDYVTAQYHSNMANTGSFMIRQGPWKYIKFGQYLSTYENYEPMLFNVEADPWEVNDVSALYPNVSSSLDKLLLSQIPAYSVDCKAKQNDLYVFNHFFWNVYNASTLYGMFQNTYKGFNQSDWQKVLQWRQELSNGPPCS